MWSQLLYDESVCPGVVPEAFGSMVTLTTKGKSFSKVFHADYTKKKTDCSSNAAYFPSSLSISSFSLTIFLSFLSSEPSTRPVSPVSPFPHSFQSSLPSGCLPCR